MAREPGKRIARLKPSQISYESGYERTIDLAGVRGDVVVIMGEEVTHPDRGRTLRRENRASPIHGCMEAGLVASGD